MLYWIIGGIVCLLIYIMFFSKTTRSIRKLQKIANGDPIAFFNRVNSLYGWEASQIIKPISEVWRIVIMEWDGDIYITYEGTNDNVGELAKLAKRLNKAYKESNPKVKNEHRVMEYHTIGLGCMTNNKFEEAIGYFNKAIQIDNKNESIYDCRGIAHGGLGDFDMAIVDFTKVIELNPTNAEGYCNRGVAYSRKHEFNQAIKDFDRAIELNPSHTKAIRNREIAYGINGGKDESQIKQNKLNVAIDPEVIFLGIKIAGYHIERGVRKFPDYAKAMIEDFGDEIIPYLKPFYNGIRDMPEISEFSESMDSYQTVSEFDINTLKSTNNKLI